MTMKFFELVPSGTRLEFLKYRWRFISLSIIAIVVSIFAMVYRQVTTGAALNYGIDFAGGSQVQLALKPDAGLAVEQVRDALVELGYEGSSAVTVPDKENEVLVRVKEVLSIDESTLAACEQAAAKVGDANLVAFSHPEGGSKIFLSYDTKPNYRDVERVLDEAGCQGSADKGAVAREGEHPVDVSLIGIGAKLRDQLDEKFGAGTVDHIVRAETVGSKVGSQLKTDGAKALLYAIGFIFLYVMVRFDLRFAPGGIVALAHDGFLIVGAFALTGKEFNLQTVAAVLTIIGYSINDTIVVFDRIRERIALKRDEPIEDVANTAINETLSRTLLTTATTVLVVAAIYVMGSGTIKDFAFALLVGLAVGTYSSIFMATPVFLWVNKRFYGGKGHLIGVENEEREGTGTLLGSDSAAAADAAADGRPGGTEIDMPEHDTGTAEPSEGEDEGPRKTTRRRRRRPE
jgi:preprotein translocase subunit SecF